MAGDEKFFPSKIYGERLIFRDVTFKVVDGEKIGDAAKAQADFDKAKSLGYGC